MNSRLLTLCLVSCAILAVILISPASARHHRRSARDLKASTSANSGLQWKRFPSADCSGTPDQSGDNYWWYSDVTRDACINVTADVQANLVYQLYVNVPMEAIWATHSVETVNVNGQNLQYWIDRYWFGGSQCEGEPHQTSSSLMNACISYDYSAYSVFLALNTSENEFTAATPVNIAGMEAVSMGYVMDGMRVDYLCPNSPSFADCSETQIVAMSYAGGDTTCSNPISQTALWMTNYTGSNAGTYRAGVLYYDSNVMGLPFSFECYLGDAIYMTWWKDTAATVPAYISTFKIEDGSNTTHCMNFEQTQSYDYHMDGLYSYNFKFACSATSLPPAPTVPASPPSAMPVSPSPSPVATPSSSAPSPSPTTPSGSAPISSPTPAPTSSSGPVPAPPPTGCAPQRSSLPVLFLIVVLAVGLFASS